MIVDDTSSMRGLLRAILFAIGVTQVMEARNGAEALAQLRARMPDLIFSDWAMDVMDGRELVRQIRASDNADLAMLPVVMITGHADKEHVQEARDIGVTEFLAKPVSPKAVAERIEAIIHRSRPFVRTSSFFGPDRRRRVESFEGVNRREPDDAREALLGSPEVQAMIDDRQDR